MLVKPPSRVRSNTIVTVVAVVKATVNRRVIGDRFWFEEEKDVLSR